jgi:hypothetical protein
MMKAIADGMATADETFPPLDTKPDAGETPAETEQSSTQEAARTPAATETGQPASDQLSQQPSASQGSTAAASSEPEAGEAAPKEAKDTTKKQADQPKDQEPKNEKEYIAYANAWREDAIDPVAAMARWKDEKKLRNSPCNVSPDKRDELLAKLQARCADLQKAEG